LFLMPGGHACEPILQLSGTIIEFVNILVSTPVAGLRAKRLPARAIDLIFGRFDFSEMTKRSHGPHWGAPFSRRARQFVKAFTQRLLIAYGRTVRASGDERIQFQKEIVDGKDAQVKTRVSGRGDELAIDYHFHAIDRQCKVYDMVIDHISIVNITSPSSIGSSPSLPCRTCCKNEAARLLSRFWCRLCPAYFWTNLKSKALAGSGGASSLSSARISSMAICSP
jgi:hypothetical protein